MKTKIFNALSILSIAITFFITGLIFDNVLSNTLSLNISEFIYRYQILIAGLLAILAALISSAATRHAAILPHLKNEDAFVDDMIDACTKIRSLAENHHNHRSFDTKDKLLEQKERISAGKIFSRDVKTGQAVIKLIRKIDRIDINSFDTEIHLSQIESLCTEIVTNLIKMRKY